jgi:RNase P subunit RPR2
MSNNKVIDGLYQMYKESVKMDSSRRDSVIDEMAVLYTHGARIKNPKDYESIYCTTCNKLIGWSPYFHGSDYVIYCRNAVK